MIRCAVDGCDNGTASTFEPFWLNNTMPWNWTETRTGCDIYNYTWNQDTCSSGIPPDSQIPVPCNEWVYDTTAFDTTILTDVIFTNILYLHSKWRVKPTIWHLNFNYFVIIFYISKHVLLNMRRDSTIYTWFSWQFELTCDNEWKQTLITTIFMVGAFFGSVSLSSVSDMYIEFLQGNNR